MIRRAETRADFEAHAACWRGICVYTVGLEEARRIASGDPSVRAGRLEPVVFTWMARAGAVSFGAGT